jgi:drug/metabolite transporter (DMT)-like permease
VTNPVDWSLRTKRLAAYAATWLIWGSTYLAIRFGVETIPPFLMAGVRSVAAGAILCAWALLRGDERPSAAQWRAAAVAGALFFLVGHGGLFWAEQRVPSGPSALFVATEHLWIVLLAWALPGGRHPSPRAWAGIALGLGGVALLTLGGPGSGTVDPLGAAVILLCALAWAVGLTWFRGARRPESDAFAAGTPLVAGGAMLMVASVLFGEPGRVEAADLTPLALGSLAYLIAFGSVVAFTALTWLTRKEGPSRSASYTYVNPLVAVALGAAFANERLTPRVLLAGVTIVLAVVLIISGSAAQEDPAERARVARRVRSNPSAAARLREGEA